MQTSYQIKSELNVLVNSTNNTSSIDAPYCRKKLDFHDDKKPTLPYELTPVQKRSHFPKTPSNSKRNARERRRVKTINDYFSQLQKFLPHTKPATANGAMSTIKKMSKVETLKAAIEYIEYLVKFAPSNSQQLFQMSKSSSTSSSLLSSPASSVSSNSTQVLMDKFKNTLNNQVTSPSKLSPSSPSTIQNNSNCSTPKSNCNESLYNGQSQYPIYQSSNYYNYPECNYYNSNYYYNTNTNSNNHAMYNQYDNYENSTSNSINGYSSSFPIENGCPQSIVAQMSPTGIKSAMSSSSSSISSNGSTVNFYQYNFNEIKNEYFMNECESRLNM
ncbi:unnamed protein product [Brachionus calyciflorus]|uniref:BHLH domain-containing protein n=1 Tax=Brachionus calyciflorus TaxID=104777 RepID=A0A813SCR4_9BILA|nr:unnamed protein product [Brachionus calyciflorus]